MYLNMLKREDDNLRRMKQHDSLVQKIRDMAFKFGHIEEMALEEATDENIIGIDSNA